MTETTCYVQGNTHKTISRHEQKTYSDSKVLCQKAYTKTSARDLLIQGTTSHLQQVNDTLCDISPEGQK